MVVVVVAAFTLNALAVSVTSLLLLASVPLPKFPLNKAVAPIPMTSMAPLAAYRFIPDTMEKFVPAVVPVRRMPPVPVATAPIEP